MTDRPTTHTFVHPLVSFSSARRPSAARRRPPSFSPACPLACRPLARPPLASPSPARTPAHAPTRRPVHPLAANPSTRSPFPSARLPIIGNPPIRPPARPPARRFLSHRASIHQTLASLWLPMHTSASSSTSGSKQQLRQQSSNSICSNSCSCEDVTKLDWHNMRHMIVSAIRFKFTSPFRV